MKRISIFSIIMGLGLLVQAQQPLSLADALSKALANNYDIRITQKRQDVAEVNNTWGAAGRFPYVNFTVQDNNNYNINDNKNVMTNRISGDASLNWTLFEGFKVNINKDRLEELEQLSKQNTAIMVEGTVQSVVLAYYDALLQQEKLKTFEEVMALSEDRYKRAEDQKAIGSLVTYDVLQAKNAYLSDRSTYLTQKVAYANALRNLKFLMAEKEGDYTLTEAFEAQPKDYLLDDLQGQMLASNKNLQNQYVNQRLLENALASARSSYMPKLTFNGGLRGNTVHTKLEDQDGFWAKSADAYGNFTLSINLFGGGQKRRAVQIAKIEEESGLIEVEAKQHELGNSLANLFEFYQVRKELLTVADENLAAAQLNLQLSKEKFQSGAINSFNYRDIQNIYLNAAQRKLEAIYNFIDTHTALLRMTGSIVQEFE